MLNPNEPYNELPELPPIQQVETNAALKSVIEARSALNELHLICNILPNTIPILEAKGSSEKSRRSLRQRTSCSSSIRSALTNTTRRRRKLIGIVWP